MLKLTLIISTLLIFLGCTETKKITLVEKKPQIVISQNIVNMYLYILEIMAIITSLQKFLLLKVN